MGELAYSANNGPFAADDGTAMERRIFRGMCAIVALCVLASLVLYSWRVTTGLLLGGALSLLNYHWLRTSVTAALGAGDGRHQIRIARFLLRYFVVATVITAAHLLDLASLVASLFGLV
jgi:hypothetical protein